MGDCAAADDNPMKLMSIAMKPLCSPPFPLDYIEEMTALMVIVRPISNPASAFI